MSPFRDHALLSSRTVPVTRATHAACISSVVSIPAKGFGNCDTIPIRVLKQIETNLPPKLPNGLGHGLLIVQNRLGHGLFILEKRLGHGFLILQNRLGHGLLILETRSSKIHMPFLCDGSKKRKEMRKVGLNDKDGEVDWVPFSEFVWFV